MTVKLHLTQKTITNIDRNSSKGNQLKWVAQGKWYKADYLGYEGLAEFFISRLLGKTNVSSYVKYEIAEISYKGITYQGCISRDFLRKGEELVTLEKLFRQYRNVSITRKLLEFPAARERIAYVVEGVQEITGLGSLGSYLCMLLEMDAFFLNEDRHMNNIAVIRDTQGGFRLCPVFDNGAALFSDVRITYPMDKDIEACRKEIEAKPFSRDFDEQMDAAEELYGQQFRIRFDRRDVANCLEEANGYGQEITHRIRQLMDIQLRKYQFLTDKGK